jgi:hypothetical protein
MKKLLRRRSRKIDKSKIKHVSRLAAPALAAIA